MSEIEEKPIKKRTNAQNKALHLWCEMLAYNLNEKGLNMRVVLKPEIDIEWNKENVKKYLYHPIMQAVTGKDSTTELSTTDPDKIWEIFNRHMGEKFGVEIPKFPSEEQTKEYFKSLTQKM